MRKGDKIKVPRSKEHRSKLSLALQGNKNQEKRRSEITKQKIAKALKGNKHTFGYNHSKEMRMKCRIAKTGKNNPAWQGGISFEPYSLEWKKEIKDLIKQRDNYTCQICQKLFSQEDKELHIHHIDYNKKNCLPENLISLCHSCHSKTNHKRKFWQNHLQGVINGQLKRVFIDVG